MKDIRQYRYITHKNKNIMIQVIVKTTKQVANIFVNRLQKQSRI